MKDFQTTVVEWLDAQMQTYQQAIDRRKGDYLKKKWPWTEAAASDFNRRLEELAAIHSSLLTELAFGKAHGDGLLTLANIVFNEAGVANRAAKVAIAYAWMNRTGGVVREPKGSGDQQLHSPARALGRIDRHRAIDLPAELLAQHGFGAPALERGEPSKNDPTRGATHWVSPIALFPFKNEKGYYMRTEGKSANRAFPVWARGPNDPEVEKMKKRSEVRATYAEVAAPGVPRTDFLFYVGVNY